MEDNLDTLDQRDLRALAHRMLDDAIDALAALRDGPVWRPMPGAVRRSFDQAMPEAGANPAELYEDYRRLIAPYAVGNRHPGFMGWVHGGGSQASLLGEILAASLNANCGGRDHAPIECERQVLRWAAEMLGFPPTSSGTLVTGTSMANLLAVLIARRAACGPSVREDGLAGGRLVAYASQGVHACVPRALDFAGLGAASLRLVATGADGALDPTALASRIAEDRASGCRPFLLVGTAGGVDFGAIDPLAALAAVARREGLWFHVDAAFGAACRLSPALRPLVGGIEQADSVAFDFHKWMQVNYDAGCLIVRDAALHRDTFASPAAYLRREARGLAAGDPWPCDFGVDLSRGFRALKIWMTWRTYGSARLGRVAERCCEVARAIALRIEREPSLTLAAPVRLNIVCFRVAGLDDEGHASLAARIQESGAAAPSTTMIGGRLALRAAIVNHRTTVGDGEALINAVIEENK